MSVSEAPAPEAPVDEVRAGMLATLTEVLGDALLDSHIAHGDLWIRVPRERWVDAVTAVRDRLACDYFCYLSALDWMPSPDLTSRHERIWDTGGDLERPADDEPSSEDPSDVESPADVEEPVGSGIETGVAGGETRFQVLSRLYSTSKHWGVTLKADLDDDAPSVASITGIYRGADWHERETWEMFGIEFPGHPRLRKLYLPGEFEGFPLRKDFPLLAREVKPWPGLVNVEPLPGEAAGEGEATEGGDS